MPKNLRMPILNSAQFSGNIVRDPELKTIERGGSNPGPMNVAKFTIAVTESFVKDEHGQLKVFFLTCKAFGQLADRVYQFRKGDPLIVSGALREEKWTGKDGVEKKAFTLNVREATCIGWPDESSAPRDRDEPALPNPSSRQPADTGPEDDYPF